MIELPDIRQSAEYNCGDAAVDCVIRHFGIRTAAVFLRDGLGNPVAGMSPDVIEAVLRRCGLNVCSGEMGLADLKHHTGLGRPVLCPIAYGGGHWVVVSGVSRGGVFFHCPDRGPQRLREHAWTVNWRDTSTKGVEYDHWGIATWP